MDKLIYIFHRSLWRIWFKYYKTNLL